VSLPVAKKPHPLGEALGVAQAFSDLPGEAVIKEDVLRRGVWITDEALALDSSYAPKSYFIFSFDREPLDQVARARPAPEEIALVGGPMEFRRVVVSVRLDRASPYQVVASDGKPVLECGGEPICGVEFAPLPPYYGQKTEDGVPIVEVAPSIEWGYLLYLTVFRVCQYFGKDEECRFCDINENFRQQRQAGNPYYTVKPVERVLDALRKVAASGARAQAYTLTGGSITTAIDGLDEASFYVRYAEAIEREFPRKWIGKMVVQALPVPALERIKAAGIRIYHPNYEIWDKQRFEQICPGKARTIGRDEWLRRIVDAVPVFGRWRVIPNFVAGIELARPFGFDSVEEALRSTGEGIDWFMSRGVMPRFTTWCPEPLSDLGARNGPAPLVYHAALLRLWRDLHRAHGAPAPAGYGPPGIGRAVFSVSAFMDVIDPATPVLDLDAGSSG
jgi:hypothetical protein